MRVSTIAQVDPFVRRNIFWILQRRTRWIYEESSIEWLQELFEKFVIFAYKSRGNWDKKTSKMTRPKIEHDFDNAVCHWMERYYSNAVTFTFTNDIIYQFAVAPDGECEREQCMCVDTCGVSCLNRGTYYECSDTCPTGGDCGNRESQFPFDWKEKVSVRFVSEEVGAGVFSNKELPADDYLGHVSGVAVTLEGAAERLALGVGDYMFKIASNKKEKIQSIDPRLFGNHTRFFNHACVPNCKMEIWVVNGRKMAKMFTLRKVLKVRQENFCGLNDLSYFPFRVKN